MPANCHVFCMYEIIQFSLLHYGVDATKYYCYYHKAGGFGAIVTITSPCYVNTLGQQAYKYYVM